MGLTVHFEVLNQLGTPLMYSATLANRPAAGIAGRIFFRTDSPYGIYRDTGSAWDLIAGSSGGTITGSGAATQVAFWNSATGISGSNNLFWDSTNNNLGINTNTPGNALDVHTGTISTVAALNQTTLANNTLLAFLNTNTPLWRVGNFYTAGANDFSVFDVVGNLQQLTISNTTGQTFIGAKTTASGRLVINSATADAHLQIVGANSPSIRIDNAGSGGTQRFVIGNATGNDNFIQGSAAGDFCITTASAGPLLFGMWQTVNASEVMRITTANNLLIGSSVDGGQRLQVSGGARATGYYVDGMVAGSGALYYNSGSNRVTLANYNAGGILNFEVNGGASAATIDASGNFGLGVTPSAYNAGKAFEIGTSNGNAIWGLGVNAISIMSNAYYNTNYIYAANGFANRYDNGQGSGTHAWFTAPSGTAGNPITFTQVMTLNANGNLLLNTTTDSGEKFIVNGGIKATQGLSVTGNGGIFNGESRFNLDFFSNNSRIYSLGQDTITKGGFEFHTNNSDGTIDVVVFRIKSSGIINASNVPASSVGLVSGDIYQTAGVLNIVP